MAHWDQLHRPQHLQRQCLGMCHPWPPCVFSTISLFTFFFPSSEKFEKADIFKHTSALLMEMFTSNNKVIEKLLCIFPYVVPYTYAVFSWNIKAEIIIHINISLTTKDHGNHICVAPKGKKKQHKRIMQAISCAAYVESWTSNTVRVIGCCMSRIWKTWGWVNDRISLFGMNYSFNSPLTNKSHQSLEAALQT